MRQQVREGRVSLLLTQVLGGRKPTTEPFSTNEKVGSSGIR